VRKGGRAAGSFKTRADDSNFGKSQLGKKGGAVLREKMRAGEKPIFRKEIKKGRRREGGGVGGICKPLGLLVLQVESTKLGGGKKKLATISLLQERGKA